MTATLALGGGSFAGFAWPGDFRLTFRRASMAAMSDSTSRDAQHLELSAIERAGRGDQAAFAEFYDEVSGVVFGTVLRVLRNQAIAEEVTQEVFLELWRVAPRYERSKGSPAAWAATVARRRAVDRVRSEEAARARDQADSRLIERDRDDVVDQVTSNSERRSVIDALQQLTEAQREAVSLAYYGGHTYREVAVLLGVPEGTVKTRIRDGLIRLRDLMGATP